MITSPIDNERQQLACVVDLQKIPTKIFSYFFSLSLSLFCHKKGLLLNKTIANAEHGFGQRCQRRIHNVVLHVAQMQELRRTKLCSIKQHKTQKIKRTVSNVSTSNTFVLPRIPARLSTLAICFRFSFIPILS
jgi:hypothetical protein